MEETETLIPRFNTIETSTRFAPASFKHTFNEIRAAWKFSLKLRQRTTIVCDRIKNYEIFNEYKHVETRS